MSLFSGRNFLLSFVPLHIWNLNSERKWTQKMWRMCTHKRKHSHLVNKVVSSEILKCDISRCYPHMHIKYQTISTESAHVSFARLAAIKTSFERRQKLLPSMTALQKKGFCITDRDAEFIPGWAHSKERFTVPSQLHCILDFVHLKT